MLLMCQREWEQTQFVKQEEKTLTFFRLIT